MEDHYIKSTKVNDDNNNTNKITSVTNLDISTSSYINEIAELESLISEYDKLNAISNKSKPKTNVAMAKDLFIISYYLLHYLEINTHFQILPKFLVPVL